MSLDLFIDELVRFEGRLRVMAVVKELLNYRWKHRNDIALVEGMVERTGSLSRLRELMGATRNLLEASEFTRRRSNSPECS